MSQWVDLHVETLMNNTTRHDGMPIYGLAHYLKQIISEQERTNEPLEKLIDKQYTKQRSW
jgi:hypothetical protein